MPPRFTRRIGVTICSRSCFACRLCRCGVAIFPPHYTQLLLASLPLLFDPSRSRGGDCGLVFASSLIAPWQRRDALCWSQQPATPYLPRDTAATPRAYLFCPHSCTHAATDAFAPLGQPADAFAPLGHVPRAHTRLVVLQRLLLIASRLWHLLQVASGRRPFSVLMCNAHRSCCRG